MTETRIKWLGLLAKLCTPGDPSRAFAALEAYVPFLADLPDAAFTRASLEHVALTPRRLHIPDLSEVKTPLNAWWRDNRPTRTALPPPARAAAEADNEPPATPEQRRMMARALKDLAAQIAPPKPQKPSIRSHVVPASVLEQARAKLRGIG